MRQQRSDHEEVLYDNEDFYGKLVVKDELAFIHLTVHNWSRGVFRKVRKAFLSTLSDCKSEGHDLVFATCEDKKTIKFWKMMAPLEEVSKFGSRNQYYIGAWHIEDVLNGT